MAQVIIFQVQATEHLLPFYLKLTDQTQNQHLEQKLNIDSVSDHLQ